MSYLTGLNCLRCGRRYPPLTDAYVCEDCGAGGPGDDPGILDAEYDYDAVRRALDAAEQTDRADVFRWLPLLPLDRPGPGLPAGGTPLVSAPKLAARLGLEALYLKDETRNPTRCLKDRATSIAVALAVDQDRADVYCASAGNAAISLAGFAAHLGLAAHVFVPSYASPVRLGWLRRYGADVRVSTGNYDQAFAESEDEGRRRGWYSRNCAFNPFLVEGKKTVALEIAEQLGGRAPDWVVSPVGDGCTLGAAGKGFREARALGRLDGLPRLLGVQAEGVQPLVRRHRRDRRPLDDGRTEASSIAVRTPRNALRVLREIDGSNGAMIAVSDPEIADAQRLLAEDAGIVAEFTSAATLAGLLRLAADDLVAAGVAVLIITGGRVDEPSSA